MKTIKRTLITILLTIPLFALAFVPNEIEVDNSTLDQNIDSGAVLSVTGDSTRERVLGMIEKAGFDPKTAERVITCESNWRNEAHNWNDPNGGSHGIWQLNGIHGLTMEEMTDPIRATEEAIRLLRSSRSWEHWSCY